MKKILITGVAGFIGFHLALKLSKMKSYKVFGIDNLNNYYDINLKKNRLNILKNQIQFSKINICNTNKLNHLFKKNKFDIVFHLAAQAGVRYSYKNPDAYFKSNLIGFQNIIQFSKKNGVKHFIYASSSSVYGNNVSLPLKEYHKTDNPVSYYAATKKCNEILAEAYSNFFRLRCTGIRFFTVYGPYGRPDMSAYKFVNNILKNKKINIFNKGTHARDFTYIDDAVEAILKIINKNKNKNIIKHEIYNIGNGNSKSLNNYIFQIEKVLKKKSKKNFVKLQKGDVIKTYSDISKIKREYNFKPKINLGEGISKYIDWFKNYYK
jgi:UDP-glucuronate 4-epimerase